MKITDKIELINGDCLIEMQNIKDESIDMILCDLPYSITNCKWDIIIPFDKLWEQYERIIKPNGAIVLTALQPFTSFLIMSNIKLFKYEWIWKKSHATGHLNSKKQPMREHENICIFYKKQCTYNPQMIEKNYLDKRTKSGQNKKVDIYNKFTKVERTIDVKLGFPKTIQYFKTPFKGGEAGLHPTQKPIALMEYLIRTYTNKNEIVLDNTMGSGSTGIACINTNREFIGIELDTEYYDKAVQRIKDHVTKQKLF
jgi:DNA modification methylase